jgi:hypothetical protein
MGRKLLPMNDPGEQVYSFSARLLPGRTVQYAFYSGPNRKENQEVLPADCANSDGLRTWVVPDVDTQIVHSFGSCELQIAPVSGN